MSEFLAFLQLLLDIVCFFAAVMASIGVSVIVASLACDPD